MKSKDPSHLQESLLQDGIEYVEIRSIDLNPFEAAGISIEDLKFIHLFILFLLEQEEVEYENWQEEAAENERCMATDGLKISLSLSRNGETTSFKRFGAVEVRQMKQVNQTFSLGLDEVLNKKYHQIIHPNETISAKLVDMVSKSDYISAHLALAKQHKKQMLESRFTLVGFEDLELSTQILIREAIKEDQIDVLDRSENFIRLRKENHEEYIQQATKTSLDTYSAVLAMENKVVTKKILQQKGIFVPSGEVYSSIQEAVKDYPRYVGKHIVIKPKLTNFGVGITILEQLKSITTFKQALSIAFNHDTNVIIEQFQRGNEFRFLVIDDEVVGILQRVPANVTGDGIHSIKQLIEQKNEHPLRGTNYKRPLEKIKIDASLHLYLEEQKLTIHSLT